MPGGDPCGVKRPDACEVASGDPITPDQHVNRLEFFASGDSAVSVSAVRQPASANPEKIIGLRLGPRSLKRYCGTRRLRHMRRARSSRLRQNEPLDCADGHHACMVAIALPRTTNPRPVIAMRRNSSVGLKRAKDVPERSTQSRLVLGSYRTPCQFGLMPLGNILWRDLFRQTVPDLLD